MTVSFTDRLQPPFPKNFKVPTLVQSGTTVCSLLKNAFLENTVKNLEKKLCEYYDVKYCILVDRARTGAYLIAKTLGLETGWITTSFMHRPFTTLLENTVNNIKFADINKDFTIDPKSVVSLVDSTTKVLLATHMYGKSSDVVRLREIADENNIFLIENCVHMCGKFPVGGKYLGSWGDAALLSFNVDKPLSGLLGGAILTNRDDVWEKLVDVELHNSNVTSVIKKIGSTYIGYHLKPVILKTGIFSRKRIDGVKEIESFPSDKYLNYCPKKIHYLQKLALDANLDKIEEWTNLRIRNAEKLTSYLSESESLILPKNTKDQPNSYLYYPIIFKNHCRYKVSCALAQLGIETKWRYFPLHLQHGFESCKWNKLENTTNYWKQHLLIPIGHEQSIDQVKYISECILRTIDDMQSKISR